MKIKGYVNTPSLSKQYGSLSFFELSTWYDVSGWEGEPKEVGITVGLFGFYGSVYVMWGLNA
jgi:hypothetical protein